ncbi:MAG: ADP-ribosylglycohydrolase family protein [Armatimonadetes bacterium]|nr:ADP-ribosylglycohydrolase family protein [Armatimonadota bacterium]
MTNDDVVGQWMLKQIWLEGADPEVEWTQAKEEGRDVANLESDFEAVIAAGREGERDTAWFWRAAELCDEVQASPEAEGFAYVEPSDLEGIRAASDQIPVPAFTGDGDELLRRLHGGLLGRICGCILGKPFEGWKRHEIQVWNEETGNWPLANYVATPTPDQLARIEARGGRTKLGWAENWTRDRLDGAVEDDDINYTIAGFDIMRKYGPDFRPVDVAEYWCANLPLFMMCTAERVAYRNFTMSVLPPESATHRNPYREWIGAQIRADSFGYLNPGNPARAAEWAWRDASISHIKNGIYGEMWVAAMLATAYVESDFRVIIEKGLSYVPSMSRLHEGVVTILNLHREGKSYEEAVAAVHARWNEGKAHDWCHTISNAQLVAVALLYGENDYSKTISRAVMPGFDTDCNGATAGSVWGIVNGVDVIPGVWTKPIRDLARSHLLNYREVGISGLAGRMVELI